MKTGEIMKNKLFAGLTLSLFANLTMAAQTTDTVTVSATIPAGATCSISKSVSNVDLGDYSNDTGSTANVPFGIFCTGDASGTIDIYGSNGSGVAWQLTGPGGGLNYGILLGSDPWGTAFPFSATSSTGFEPYFTIDIPPGEITRNGGSLTPGVYTDIVTIDVNYL